MYRLKELIIILILIGFLAYLPSLFGGFVWDDEDFVFANTYVKDFQIDKFWTENAIAGRGKVSNYYRPIQFTLYSLIYKIAGPNPFFFHLWGIVLHITAAALVFMVISALTDITAISFLTSLFFLIHPIQTESVSYISGMSDQIYTIFFFLSIYFFIKRNERVFYKILSVLFFILSLLSKELALIFPGIIILISMMSLRSRFSGRSNPDGIATATTWPRDDIILIGIYIIIALLYLISRFTFLKFADIVQFWSGNPYGEHFTIRLATFFRTFFTAIGLLLFPKDLYMERDFALPVQYSLFNIWTLLFISLNALILIILYKKSRHPFGKAQGKQAPISNNPALPAGRQFPTTNNQSPNTNNPSLIFYLCFLASLIPYTGIFLLNGIFYEHYLYLPMVFFWASLFVFIPKLLKKLKVLKFLLFVIVFLFLLRSYVRQYEWIDNERFYRQTLKYAPQSVRIINGLGMTLAEKGNCQEALSVYDQAIRLDPYTPNFYHNKGNCYVNLDMPKEAENAYLKAIKVNPKFNFSSVSLLDLYINTSQKDKAKRLLENTLLKQYPGNEKLRRMYNSVK